MNANKPVAWMLKTLDGRNLMFYGEEQPPKFEQEVQYIPLYTHPVKELDEQFKKGFEAGKEEGWKAHKFHHPVKELTDEEIMKIWGEEDNELYYPKWAFIEFAKAILRKASEK